MKSVIKMFLVLFTLTSSVWAQGFSSASEGEQTFYFIDEMGRNQAVFYSEAPVESITGMSSKVDGSVTLDLTDLSDPEGKLFIPAASLKSGIDLRDEHLRSEGWLDAEKYPDISFEVKEIKNVKNVKDNLIEAEVVGDFTVKGVTKEVTAGATLTFLEESERTKSRVKRGGDLLGVKADFKINLSDYGVSNEVIGSKVAEDIDVSVNVIGSNVKP